MYKPSLLSRPQPSFLDAGIIVAMDSFVEPYTRREDDVSLEQVTAHIAQLEEQHRKLGIPLSGRIIHVCHSLPIVATLSPKGSSASGLGVLSPPATPPSSDIPESAAQPTPSEDVPSSKSAESPLWSFSPRHGHAAMISGIRSLSSTHEQLIVGWTGDILNPETDTIPSSAITPEEKASFDNALATQQGNLKDPEAEEEPDTKTHYVPVWMDDKVAHGHYDGYCKQSVYCFIPPFFSNIMCSSLAVVPLPAVARCRHRVRLGRYALPLLRVRKRHLLAPHCRGLPTRRSDLDPRLPPFAPSAVSCSILPFVGFLCSRPLLIILPHRLIRDSIPDAVIGLFVHTPFPSSEVFRCLPRKL